MSRVSEEELATKSVAPRVTQQMLDDNIIETHFLNIGHSIVMAGNGDGEDFCHESLDLLTFCVVVLQNGFTVTGQSACASPDNYNKDIGERLALADAKNKIWALMGYELRSQLLFASTPAATCVRQ